MVYVITGVINNRTNTYFLSFQEESETVFEEQHQRFSDHADRLYIFNSDFYKDIVHYDAPRTVPMLSYLTYFKLDFQLKNFYQGIEIVDSSYNSENPVFRTDAEKVYIMFHSNVPQEADRLGYGFRALVHSTGKLYTTSH